MKLKASVCLLFYWLTTAASQKGTVLKCNTRSNAKQLTLSNPYPSLALCQYTIRAYNVKVCQLRIDFHYFTLEQPSMTPQKPYAHCENDRLTINGIPFDFCGTINQNHVYVPFDVQKITDEVKLVFNLGPYSLAQWYITVNQIECNEKSISVKPDERQAPPGCLQYFYESFGLVQSFNFGGDYYGDTQYGICFNKGKNIDSKLILHDITFQMDIGATVNSENTTRNVRNNNGSYAFGFDSDCIPSTNPGGITEDYIIIPKAEVNGKLKATAFCSNSIDGEEIISHARGPFVIEVNTDTKTTQNKETGFRFRYKVV
ncbi:hypothetical protein Bhyg_06688 [Pseudolycoriella hygida]|uniref:CUB domain-containing protein n=1 Tax=Pseudolycoriella hygida TaxID=35572 RepID=A0A9Q0N150_9DIPT|nr:hypothetical protein Bhyg_06688 [Pseudolycoriella hygida]